MSYTPPWETGGSKSERKTVFDRPRSGPNAKDPDSDSFKRVARRTDENMTPKMILRRERFLLEYVKDFHGTNAALRIGIPKVSAAKQASEMLSEPYCQKRLQDLIDEMKEETIVTRNRVLAGLLREANGYFGVLSHGARVQAWARLAKILGMEKTEVNTNVTVNGGVMVVPMAASLEEWEKTSAVSQEKLKQDVRK